MIVTVGSMASVIVLNSKSSCSTCGLGSESKTGAITVATGAAAFETDLALHLVFVVALSLYGGDGLVLHRKHRTCVLGRSALNGCTECLWPVNSIQFGDCCSVREKYGKFKPFLVVEALARNSFNPILSEVSRHVALVVHIFDLIQHVE